MSRRSGWGAGKIVALILAAIVGAGIVLGIVFRKEVAVMWGDLKRYFKRVDDEAQDEDEGSTDGDAGDNTANAEKYDNMSVAEIEQNGLSLSMTPMLASDLSAQAESGIAIMATVLPENATDKTLDWSVEFVDASSAWAESKTVTDYVTVTGTEVGASVECLQPFGAQIQVKAASHSNPDVYATCTLDYYARVTGMNLICSTLGSSSQGASFTMGTEGFVGTENSQAATNYVIDDNVQGTVIRYEWVVSDYTVPLNEEESTATASYTLTKGFIDYMIANDLKPMSIVSSMVPEKPIEFTGLYASPLKYLGLSWYMFAGYLPFAGLELDKNIEAYGNQYLSLANNYSAPFAVFKVNYKDAYNDKDFYVSFSYKSGAFPVAVEDVNFDQEGVVM